MDANLKKEQNLCEAIVNNCNKIPPSLLQRIISNFFTMTAVILTTLMQFGICTTKFRTSFNFKNSNFA